jgi:two-component sensor histidine kinase
VLLSEVHHRVKNNLQIITSMLSLGLRSDDPSAALEQAIARVQAIGVVQELLYAGQKFREIECGEMLRAITSSLATVHGRDDVSIDVECAAVRLDVDRATSVALIVTELVINAYKHAFPELGAGNIRIGLARSGGANTLTVADDGVPFPDAGDRSGTGLRIAQALARKLGGELEVNTGREKSVSVTFPIPEGGANAASSEQSVHGSIA